MEHKGRLLILANAESTVYCFRRELIEKLVKDGYEVFVSFPCEKYAKVIEATGCTVIDTKVNKKGRNPFEELSLIAEYKNIIKTVKPDLVVTYTIKPNIYGGLAARKLNVKYINTVTGLGVVFMKNSSLNLYVRHLLKKALKKSSCVFFENEYNLKLLTDSGICKAPTVLTSGTGVNLELYKFEDMTDSDKVGFVVVSHLLKDKGYDEIFEVVKRIKDKYGDKVHFDIVGRMPNNSYKKQIDELVDNGYIVYHGEIRQEEVRLILKNGQCLIHASHHEGLSNAVMEACATGRPAIVTDIPGCREAVDDNVNGYLFEKCNASELYECVDRFINLPFDARKKMGIAARRKVEREFDRNSVIETYESIIAQTIKDAECEK